MNYEKDSTCDKRNKTKDRQKHKFYPLTLLYTTQHMNPIEHIALPFHKYKGQRYNFNSHCKYTSCT